MAASDITVAGLTAINDVSGVKLAWTYSDPRSNALPNIGLDMVEVHASATNDRTTATKVGEGVKDFLHAGLSRGAVRYYWIKARDNIGGFGAWYPSSPTGGVVGTELSGDVLIATNGYWKHPSGLIMQWGYGNFFGGFAISFPTAFPTACLAVLCGSPAGPYFLVAGIPYTTTGFPAYAYDTAGAIGPAVNGQWLAVGY